MLCVRIRFLHTCDIENFKGNIAIDTLENIAKNLKVEPYLLLKDQGHNTLKKRINTK